MNYEELVLEAEKEGVELLENCNIGRLKGLYIDQIISLSSNIKTESEKKCILCEEIGHYHTSYGNILDQSKVENRKQERRAKGWAYEKLIPLNGFIKAFKNGVRNRYELAEFLNVTEQFLEETIKYYKEKHGPYFIMEDYIIYFEPLGILERFSDAEMEVKLA